MLLPRKSVPALSIALTDGSQWTLSEQAPENFTLIAFYRGLHCPVCKNYLQSLQGHLDAFEGLGVKVLAASSDSETRAQKAKEDWELDKLDIGHSLSISEAREWGLFVSAGVSDKEPETFSEPGLFLVRADGTLYFSSVQTMPFARPSFDDIVGATKFVLDKEYPARGELPA